jgi:fructose/tagatose bisphosphate aldolase
MAIADGKKIPLKTGDGGYSVGAFNTTNLIQIETVVEAAVQRGPLRMQRKGKIHAAV